MAALRVFGHTFQMIFLAGSTLLLLLIVLSGAIQHFPIDRFYWIEADTSNISGAPSYSRWTYWGLCGKSGSDNSACDNLAPAYPFSPVDNFGTTDNIPTDFVNNQDVYYYLSRCAWSFFLIALIFTGVSFVSALFACCWFSARSVLTLFVSIGVFFDMAAIACQTAVLVLGKKAFKNSSISSKIGIDLMAIGWASLVCLILAWFGTCCAAATSVYKRHKEHVAHEKYVRELENNNNTDANNDYQQSFIPAPAPAVTTGGGDEDENPYTATPAAAQQATPAQPVASAQQNQGTLVSNEGGIRFFKIRRNNKSDEDSI